MKKEKNVKIMTILFLCVAVVGFAVGFAAFSNTLTISSSATVSPDESDFKIVIYGKAATDGTDDFSSTTSGMPNAYFPLAAPSLSVIDNDKLTIKHEGMEVNVAEIVRYDYLIVNEGKYDAYIKKEDFPSESTLKNGTVCTPIDENINEELLQAACQGARMIIRLYDSYEVGELLYSDSMDTSSDYLKISPGEEFLLDVIFHPTSKSISPADGKYLVQYPDVELKFSTVNPES